MMNKLLAFLQHRCRHESNNVMADILEGATVHEGIQWCRTCGAYRKVFFPFNPLARKFQDWRLPQQ